MFENVTYEDILQRMLDRVPDTMDKREGSVIYDALAPAAIEFMNLFMAYDMVLKESYADTASLEYLIRKAKERGIVQKEATSAILKAIATPTDIVIQLGSRFSLNLLNYVVTEQTAPGEYTIQCETPGSEANSYFGSMIPIDYVTGLETIEATELLIPGEDEEDVESLRERYFESISSQAFGGNIADYKEKTIEIAGVGGVKVTPTWAGGGTVKLTIIDSTFGVPSAELVNNVQQIIDPRDWSGEGFGLAPIGHRVTVVAATGVTIDIAAEITYKSGWSWSACASYIFEAVDNFLLSLSKKWDSSEEIIVRISQLEAEILKCDGVLDVAGTTLNGSATNLHLAENEIPIRGSVNGNE